MKRMETTNRLNSTKLPAKRFDIALHKFLDVVIPLHLEILNKHQENITKFQRLEEWEKLHHEQVNASRTVQQLKADIREIDKVRQQILDDDVELFDKKIMPVRLKALKAIQEFIDCHNIVTDPTKLLHQKFPEKSLMNLSDSENTDSSNLQAQQQDMAIKTSAVAESWHHLHRDLLDLNHVINDFSEHVHKQQTAVDDIESNLDDAYVNVHEGTSHLTKAAKLKTAMFPIAGALIGCVAAGPIGFVAGAKLGLAAGVGCGILGYQGGKILKRRSDKVSDVELMVITNQNAKGSISLPDFHTNDKQDALQNYKHDKIHS